MYANKREFGPKFFSTINIGVNKIIFNFLKDKFPTRIDLNYLLNEIFLFYFPYKLLST